MKKNKESKSAACVSSLTLHKVHTPTLISLTHTAKRSTWVNAQSQHSWQGQMMDTSAKARNGATAPQATTPRCPFLSPSLSHRRQWEHLTPRPHTSRFNAHSCEPPGSAVKTRQHDPLSFSASKPKCIRES